MSLVAPRVADTSLGFERFVETGSLQPAYQPIVDLTTRAVVGFEALARWPNLADATPDVVFEAARENGRTLELDWACRLAALEGALAFGLDRRHVLFVNVEPETLGRGVPKAAEPILAAAQSELRVVIELTERSLARHPAELLRLVEWARTNGWGIALDDVGAEPASLALLPFLAPDVIKLDISLVRQRPTSDQAAIMAAVMAHSEHTGAVVLAEGIETQAHLDQALALGATLGQGWLLGRPGPLLRTSSAAERARVRSTVRCGRGHAVRSRVGQWTFARRPERAAARPVPPHRRRWPRARGHHQSCSPHSKRQIDSLRRRRCGTPRLPPAALWSPRSASISQPTKRRVCSATDCPEPIRWRRNGP